MIAIATADIRRNNLVFEAAESALRIREAGIQECNDQLAADDFQEWYDDPLAVDY